ncbi:MAG: protein kinase [Chloroflexi bacterium]|nr:protein kinase [Chloroflexota bacterium]
MVYLVGQTLDHYRVEQLLGQGGMGMIYQAIDINTQRPVALKVMHDHLTNNQQFKQRFQQEAETVAGLDHPNIVRVLEFSHNPKRLYIVMELVSGGSLRDHLARLHREGHGLPLDEALTIGRQIAEALHYAHERGIIHRDVKPDNILLRPLSEDVPSRFQAMLTDFGLAKLAEGMRFTVTGRLLGTYAYASPEQCNAEKNLDGRTDIYALGVVLYEMTAGRMPFEPKTPMEALRVHTKVPPPPPSSVMADYPAALEAVVLKCLEKARDARYANGKELANALWEVQFTLRGEGQLATGEVPAAEERQITDLGLAGGDSAAPNAVGAAHAEELPQDVLKNEDLAAKAAKAITGTGELEYEAPPQGADDAQAASEKITLRTHELAQEAWKPQDVAPPQDAHAEKNKDSELLRQTEEFAAEEGQSAARIQTGEAPQAAAAVEAGPAESTRDAANVDAQARRKTDAQQVVKADVESASAVDDDSQAHKKTEAIEAVKPPPALPPPKPPSAPAKAPAKSALEEEQRATQQRSAPPIGTSEQEKISTQQMEAASFGAIMRDAPAASVKDAAPPREAATPREAALPVMLDMRRPRDTQPLGDAPPPEAIAPELDRIVIFHQDQQVAVLAINARVLLIGRDAERDIVLPSKSVSRKHARLERAPDGSYRIIDLGSVNGSRIEDYPLPAHTPLAWAYGQALFIGDFTLRLEAAPAKREADDAPVAPMRRNQYLNITIAPNNAKVEPGRAVDVQIVIANNSYFEDQVTLEVRGLPGLWAVIADSSLHMRAGESASTTITFTPPRSWTCRAGRHVFTLRIYSAYEQQEVALATGALHIMPLQDFSVELTPSRLHNRGEVRVTVTNQGNVTDNYLLQTRDNESALRFELPYNRLRLEPGKSEEVPVKIQPRDEALVHGAKLLPFEIGVRGDNLQQKWVQGEILVVAYIAHQPPLPIWPDYPPVQEALPPPAPYAAAYASAPGERLRPTGLLVWLLLQTLISASLFAALPLLIVQRVQLGVVVDVLFFVLLFVLGAVALIHGVLVVWTWRWKKWALFGLLFFFLPFIPIGPLLTLSGWLLVRDKWDWFD